MYLEAPARRPLRPGPPASLLAGGGAVGSDGMAQFREDIVSREPLWSWAARAIRSACISESTIAIVDCRTAGVGVKIPGLKGLSALICVLLLLPASALAQWRTFG